MHIISSALHRLKNHLVSRSLASLFAEGCVMLSLLVLVIGSLSACGYSLLLMIATQEFMERF